jgi:hypothetical protein
MACGHEVGVAFIVSGDAGAYRVARAPFLPAGVIQLEPELKFGEEPLLFVITSGLKFVELQAPA